MAKLSYDRMVENEDQVLGKLNPEHVASYEEVLNSMHNTWIRLIQLAPEDQSAEYDQFFRNLTAAAVMTAFENGRAMGKSETGDDK